MLTERPEAIIITFPVQFLIDLACSHHLFGRNKKAFILNGYKQCIREVEEVMKHPDEMIWYHSIGNKPTFEVLYAYITVLNTIKWRANVAGWEPGHEKQFSDQRKMYAKHWLILSDFVNAPEEIKFKGCQGFRYSKKLF